MKIERNENGDLKLYSQENKEINLSGLFHEFVQECQVYKTFTTEDFYKYTGTVLKKINLDPKEMIKRGYKLMTSPKVCVFSKEIQNEDLTETYKEFLEVKQLLCKVDSQIEEDIYNGFKINDLDVINSLLDGVIHFRNKQLKMYVRPKDLKTGIADGYAFLVKDKKIKLMFYKLRHWGNPYGIQTELI